MDEVASDDCHSTVRKANSDLRQIAQYRECGYWERLPSICDRDSGETTRYASLLVGTIQSPDFQYRLMRQVFGEGDE